jgi:cytochrome P450 family 110
LRPSAASSIVAAVLKRGSELKPTIDPKSVAEMKKSVPAPSMGPLRQSLAFANDQYGFLASQREALGDLFIFEIPREPPRVVVGSPEEIKKIFALHPDDYYSGDPATHVNFGESCVLFNDGERHRLDRQLLTPPLHGEALRSYRSRMLASAERVVDTFAEGETTVAHEAFREMTFEVISSCVLGASARGRAHEVPPLLEAWFERMYSPWTFTVASFFGLNQMRRRLEAQTDRLLESGSLGWKPFAGKKSVELKARAMRLLLEDVADCRANGEGRTDVLALLSRATYEDGEPMPDKAIVDQLVLLVSAGHETTAKSLTWALRDILQRPEVEARARAELDRIFGAGPIDPERASELTYLDAVIKESMRLSPVTTILQRELRTPMEIGGVHIPAGVVLAPSNFLAHRDPSVFPDPDEFRPERFLDARFAPYEYFPFGGGRRRCLGLTFATTEMPILLGSVLRRTKLRIAPKADHTPTYGGVTLGPKDGLRVVVDSVRT